MSEWIIEILGLNKALEYLNQMNPEKLPAAYQSTFKGAREALNSISTDLG